MYSLVKLRRIKENMVKHDNCFGLSPLSRNEGTATEAHARTHARRHYRIYLSWNLAAFPVFVSSFSPKKSKERPLVCAPRRPSMPHRVFGDGSGCWERLLLLR